MYWIWKAFSNLASEYRKSKWKYFFLGLGSYYVVAVLSVFVVVIVGIVSGFYDVESQNFDSGEWNLFYLLSGASGCYGCYKFLEHKSQKERELSNQYEIESIGAIEEN